MKSLLLVTTTLALALMSPAHAQSPAAPALIPPQGGGSADTHSGSAPGAAGSASRKVSVVEAVGREVRQLAGNRELLAAGLLDVTATPYNADPTGRRDATAALQRAVEDARDARLIAHLPAGRYLVSGTIEGIQGEVAWDSWPYEGFADAWVATASFEYPCVLRGPATGGRAVLVLADGGAGFRRSRQPPAGGPFLGPWVGREIPRQIPTQHQFQPDDRRC